jgi:hypothetical protein
VLAAGLAVDIAAAPDLATAEHLIAVAVGVGLALAVTRHRRGAEATGRQREGSVSVPL